MYEKLEHGTKKCIHNVGDFSKTIPNRTSRLGVDGWCHIIMPFIKVYL